MVLGWILLIIAGACALVFPKSKWVAFGICLFMFIIYGFSSYSGDHAIYELVYNNVGQGQMLTEFEPAFTLLMMICNFIHLPFIGFRIVLAIIYITLLYIAVNKYTNCIALVLFVFLLFPFTYFFSVLRAGLSGIIIVLGVSHLVKMQKWWWLKFLIYIVIAALFHYSAIIFLPLILAGGRSRKSSGFFIVALLMAGLVYILFNMGVIASFLQIFTERSKIINWVSVSSIVDRSNAKGIISSLLVLAACIFFSYTSSRIYDKHTSELGRSLDSYPARLANTVKYINILLIILIPFLLLTSVYLRFIWEIILLDFCVMVNAAEITAERNIKTGRSLYRNVSFNSLPALIFAGLLFIYTNLVYVGTANDGWKIFENNYILNFLGM